MRVFEAGNMFPGMVFDPGSIIGAGVSLAGSLIGGSSASSAANAQQQANAAAIAEQRREFDLVRQTEAPFVGVGQKGIGALGWLLGLGSPTGNQASSGSGSGSSASSSAANGGTYFMTGSHNFAGGAVRPFHISSDGTQLLYDADNQPLSAIDLRRTLANGDVSQYAAGSGAGAGAGAGSGTDTGNGGYGGYGSFGSLTQPFSLADFRVDPGYQFALTEGQRALQRTQAANGQLQSGAAAKAMETYSQGVADQQYGAAFDRYNTNQTNLYNRLMGVSQLGQAAASNQTSAGSNMANNVSSLMTAGGANQANGIIGQGNAWQSGLSNLGQFATGLFNNNSSASGPGAVGMNNSQWSNFLAAN